MKQAIAERADYFLCCMLSSALDKGKQESINMQNVLTEIRMHSPVWILSHTQNLNRDGETLLL